MRATAREGAPSLEGDFSRLKGGAASTVARLDRFVHEMVEAEPLVAVGVAAGLGFVIGGGMTSAKFKGLIDVGARMAGAWLVKEYIERPSTEE